jgi:hypothetical protein
MRLRFRAAMSDRTKQTGIDGCQPCGLGSRSEDTAFFQTPALVKTVKREDLCLFYCPTLVLTATDTIGHDSMAQLVTCCAESDQVFLRVIAQSAPPLNVMDLKFFHPPARLATPAVPLQNFTAKFAISFRFKH